MGQSELVVITERVDDVALLIAQMIKMGLPEVLDRHLPRQGIGKTNALLSPAPLLGQPMMPAGKSHAACHREGAGARRWGQKDMLIND
jgi:hypothetical protein